MVNSSSLFIQLTFLHSTDSSMSWLTGAFDFLNRSILFDLKEIYFSKVKNDPRSEFSNLSNWKEEA